MKSLRKKVNVKKWTFLKKIWVIIAPFFIWTTFFNQFMVLGLSFNYLILALERKIAKNGCYQTEPCVPARIDYYIS